MKQTANPNNLPVFHGILTADGRGIKFWRPYCQCMHRHGSEGMAPTSTAITSRVAHCASPSSPLGQYMVGILQKKHLES